ncbi:MAG: LTA synthase family protein [Lachnospiraceae bacterium]|nr:LTA synthase family protein [Lachnospiraceae bacterium]
MIVLELLFHWEIYRTIDIYMLLAVYFSLPFSALTLLLSSTKWERWNRSIRSVMLFFVMVYYIAQIVYHQVFGNFLSLKSVLNGAGQAMDFGSTIWEAVLEHVVVIVVAIILWISHVVWDVRGYKKQESAVCKTEQTAEEKSVQWKPIAIYILLMLLLPIFGTTVLMFQGTGIGTTYDVKLMFHRTEQSMYRLGLMQTLKKDVTENICDVVGVTEKQINAGYLWIEETFFTEDVDKLEKDNDGASITDKTGNVGNADGESNENGASIAPDSEATFSKNVQQEVKYHTWNIDFDSLIANAENEDIKDVHTYFSNQAPTKENIYTGLFEGYNLIYITAESFSDVIIDKERTPTLYKMQQEGFQFNNFYTPSWYLSTIDGEYVNLLGQIPVEGDWSLQHSAEQALPMALGNQLKEQGYVCNAYHNHDSYYYDRTITHPQLGYAFKAVGAGLTFESMYPESDLELMEITVDEYIGSKQPFHTYYMTMSGHLPYTYAYNSMAVKNQEVVAGEEWTENAACYLAANTELEYAVAYLVDGLEKAGKLYNTLFVIAPDHYPYGLKRGAYDELQGKEIEKDAFEIYRNGCLIWSASMKNMTDVSFPVRVDKYCSNLDLMPTISNLMGLSYDSRLFAGRDMLSEEMGLVMFKDQSFLTDKVRYNATNGEVTWTEGVMEDSIYLEECMKQVHNRFYYSAKVLEIDYYNLIGKE